MSIEEARGVVADVREVVAAAATTRGMWRACNTIISQAQAIKLYEDTIRQLREELAHISNSVRAMQDIVKP